MRFDVRYLIGLMFLAIGLIVAACGVLTPRAVLEASSPGLNIDLVWGLAMAGFGAVMLALALLARRKTDI